MQGNGAYAIRREMLMHHQDVTLPVTLDGIKSLSYRGKIFATHIDNGPVHCPNLPHTWIA
jgi:hypothetical protein